MIFKTVVLLTDYISLPKQYENHNNCLPIAALFFYIFKFHKTIKIFIFSVTIPAILLLLFFVYFANKSIMIDEIQRYPHLFCYLGLKTKIDE